MKKGSSAIAVESVRMAPNLFLLTLVFVFILITIGVHLNRGINTSELEGHILTTRLFYSPNCFLYEDDIRKYPGIIDLDKFNQNTLENCISDKEGRGFIVELKELNGDSIQIINVNEDVSYFLDFCKLRDKNFDCIFEEKYVLLEEDNEFKPVLFTISLVVKNE